MNLKSDLIADISFCLTWLNLTRNYTKKSKLIIRINYPLSLKPDDDPSHLKETVLQLRSELKQLRNKTKQNGGDSTQLNNLKVEIEALKEKVVTTVSRVIQFPESSS
jgi:hypothetical protein